MNVLVVGASGSTGKLLVTQLLSSGHAVKVVIRPSSQIPDHWQQHHQLTVIRTQVTATTVEEWSAHVADCHAAASCLGHNLTLKGVYGQPRKLVTDTVQALSNAIISLTPAKPFRFVLMNTAGNSNRNLKETLSLSEKMVIGLIRLLLPPHVDNEQAADVLRVKIGQQNPYLEWVVVRPDSLINMDKVTPYSLHPSPTRSPLFNPGKTSRINVGHFMARLILDDPLWEKWKGQMPVIYNKEMEDQ